MQLPVHFLLQSTPTSLTSHRSMFQIVLRANLSSLLIVTVLNCLFCECHLKYTFLTLFNHLLLLSRNQKQNLTKNTVIDHGMRLLQSCSVDQVESEAKVRQV